VVPGASYAGVLSAIEARNIIGAIVSPEPPAHFNIERDIPPRISRSLMIAGSTSYWWRNTPAIRIGSGKAKRKDRVSQQRPEKPRQRTRKLIHREVQESSM